MPQRCVKFGPVLEMFVAGLPLDRIEDARAALNPGPSCPYFFDFESLGSLVMSNGATGACRATYFSITTFLPSFEGESKQDG